GTHDAVDALFDTRNVFLRNRAADDLRLENEILALGVGLEHDLDASELTGTTGLLLVRVVLLVSPRNRLAIGNLRRADIRFDLELATHAVNQNVQMQLAHAGDDRLAALLVGLYAEGRI